MSPHAEVPTGPVDSTAPTSAAESNSTTTTRGINRRTVVAASAWSVPAVIAATATPAAAASPPVSGLVVTFNASAYDISPGGTLDDLSVTVRSSTTSAAVSGVTVTFTIDAIPDSASPVAADAAAEAEDSAVTGGRAANASFPSGSTAIGMTDSSGNCLAARITAGAGNGVLRITATATKGSLSASAIAFITVDASGGTGYLWSFGRSAYGSLGNGNTRNQPIPARVSYYANDIKDIQPSRYAEGGMILNNAGDIYTWGYGAYGLNGQGDPRNNSSYAVPQKINSSQKFVSLASGFYSAGAITTGGAAYAWGKNTYFTVLPTGTNGQIVTTPTLIHPNLASGVKQLSLSQYSGLALKTDGTVWTWGYNYGYYALGLGPGKTAQVNVPTQITFPPGAGKIVHIHTGWTSGYAVDEAGNLWAWGSGAYYRLGTGSQLNQNTPIRINADSDRGYVRVHCSGHHAATGVLAVKSDGSASYWGYNGYGGAGNGTTSYVSKPTNIGITNVANGVVGQYSSHIVRKDGTVWSAGNNAYGQLGDGTTKTKYAWTKASLPATAKAKYVSCSPYAVFVLTEG